MRALVCFCISLCLSPILIPCQIVRAAGDPIAAATPAGRWIAVDDRTGKTKGVVDLTVAGDRLTGRVEKNLDPAYNNIKELKCISCRGDLKDKPIIGLQFLWSMKQTGSVWTGGYILDPETGNIYRCSMALEGDGKILKVRGYIGFPIFGRTQHWRRDE